MLGKWLHGTTAGARVAIVLLLGALLPASDAQAGPCASGTWTYSETSLQEARRRLKSPQYTTAARRVECGLDVSEALAVEPPPEDCTACQREYVGFAQDLIFFARQAGDKSASEKVKRAYYKKEIELRIALGTFLVDSKDQSMLDKHWGRNFDGMGDAMELAKLGERFHEAALDARNHGLSEKAFKTWARAIRSCDSWDFDKGRNRDFPGLRAVLLCADECRRALEKIRHRAQSGSSSSPSATLEVLDDLLPALDNCPVKPSS